MDTEVVLDDVMQAATFLQPFAGLVPAPYGSIASTVIQLIYEAAVSLRGKQEEVTVEDMRQALANKLGTELQDALKQRFGGG